MSRRPSRRFASVSVAAACVLTIIGVIALQQPMTPQPTTPPEAVNAAGPQRAVDGTNRGADELRAVPLNRENKPEPKVQSGPAERKLTLAGTDTFDARKLHGKVVKLERPEHEGLGPVESDEDADAAPADPDAAPADPDTDLPTSVDPNQLNETPTSNAPAPAPTTTFPGLDYATWGQGHPPDTNGDVGPTYYIQTINVSIGIYEKSTGNRVAAFTFNDFMSQGSFGNLCDTDNFGDPVVLYDSFEDRWFITDFAFKLVGGAVSPPHVFQCFAVSKTGDPVAGGWNFYSIEAPGGLADYGKFGVWPDGIYMTANMFGYAANSSFTGYHVWALNKQQMYAGEPSVQVVDFAGDTSDFTVIPANARLQTGTPPAGSPEYFVSTEQFLDALSIYKFHVDWDKVSTSTFSGPYIQAAPNCWPNALPANASTTANNADVLAIRAMAQAQYSNLGGAESLWVDHTVNRGTFSIASCGGANANNATVRWYQADVTGGTLSDPAANVVQGATYDPDAANTSFRYMPALAVDRAGDLAIGYTKSNSTTNPQIKYAGRLAGDPLNTLGQDEQTLIDGTGSQSGNCGASACIRWGDYSGMALDPNGCDFWETGEYYAVTGLNHLTQIGSFRYPSCTTVGNGTLSGTVDDGTNPIAGATVMLGSRSTTTDGSGNYSFTVPAGTYPNETAAKPGFGTGSASSLAVPDGGTLDRDFTLSAAPTSDCFTDTTQSDFQRGVASTGCDLTSSPGDVQLEDQVLVDQKNTAGTTTGTGFGAANWTGQTFIAGITGPLVQVDVQLFCFGCGATPPNVAVSIRNTSAGLPSGADLASATISGAIFADGSTQIATATLSAPVPVISGTKYAIIVRPVSAPAGSGYFWIRSSPSTYANGSRVLSPDSGGSWTADTTRDYNFHTYYDAGFPASATYTSSLKDANPAANYSPTWTTLSFTATTPASTDLKFQVAASNSSTGPWNYVGPDTTAGTYFTTSGASLSQFDGMRYLRYEAYLTSTDNTVTPTLSSVVICFSNTPITSATSLAVDPATGTYGGTTSLSATLTSGATPVSGKSIDFTLNGSGVGSATTNGSGVATLSNVSLTGINAGSYPTGVGASFAGDTFLVTSSGTNSLTVNPANQTINFAALPNKTFGNADFTVSATSSSGLTVSFGATGNCNMASATTVHITGAGSCTVTASQAGNSNYNAAPNVGRSFSIAKATTTTTISSAINPTLYGQMAKFTAQVSSTAGQPAGTVQFKIDGVNFGSPVALGAGGKASIQLSSLAIGNHTVSALYGGAANYATSGATMTQNVNKGWVKVTVTGSKNPAHYGNTVTYTVTVTPIGPATGVPNGVINLFVDGQHVQTYHTLVNGTTTFTVTLNLPNGNHSIKAGYSDGANWNTQWSALYGQIIN
jgi:hypothetical protein